MLQECGIDTHEFTAHSTRHAATSAAFKKVVSVDVIRSTAGWTNESKVFAKFYNTPICSSTQGDFGISILDN